MQIQEQIKQHIGVVVCQSCENGDHSGQGKGYCVCRCCADPIDQDRRADERENVTSWLSDAITNVGSLLTSLERVHRDACEFEPVTAMVILPQIEQAIKMRDKLRELQGVRQ